MANAEDNEPLDLDAMQAIVQAVAATEKEIFGETFGGTGEPEDETGDRSLEEMEASPSGEEDDAAEASDPDGSKEHAETEAAKTDQPRAEDGTFKAAAEKEAAPVVAAAPVAKEPTIEERIAAAVEARMAAIEAKLAAPKVEQPAPKIEQPNNQIPDQFLDPVGHTNWLLAQQSRAVSELRAEFSLKAAAKEHGETFKKAYAEFGKLNPNDPQQQQTGRSIAQASDPGEAMVAWYRQQETLRRVGADPEAYEARVREEARMALAKDPEFRKQLLADIQKEAAPGDTGKPRTVIKLPPSLSAASGSNSSRTDDPELLNGSDRAIFAHAFRE